MQERHLYRKQYIDSFAEAFLTVSAETVIAALWPVGDKSAADISKLCSEALSHAKKTMMEHDLPVIGQIVQHLYAMELTSHFSCNFYVKMFNLFQHD